MAHRRPDGLALKSMTSPTPLHRVLDTMRVSLHVMFAFLLAFGLLRAQAEGQFNPPASTLAVALAATYLAGTIYERRASAGSASALPRLAQYAWLCLLCVLWLALLISSPNFLWMEFPLVLLFLQVLPTIPGVLAAIILWAIAAFIPAWLHPGSWQVSAAIGPAIGTVLAIVIYHSYRALHAEAVHHRAIAQQLQATRDELAASEHQAGRLEERERLSREIHDTVAQGLSSIVLLTRAAKPHATGEVIAQLAAIEQVAIDNLGEARRFVRDLASPELDHRLDQALAALVERMRVRGQALGEPTEFVLSVSIDNPHEVPQPVAAAVLRIAQEGLSNVVKHAHATKAVTTVALIDAAVTVDVVDNGRGFTPPTTPDSRNGPVAERYGLQGLRRRVATLGGTLEVESSPGASTALAARIPLTSQRAALARPDSPAPKEHS